MFFVIPSINNPKDINSNKKMSLQEGAENSGIDHYLKSVVRVRCPGYLPTDSLSTVMYCKYKNVLAQAIIINWVHGIDVW